MHIEMSGNGPQIIGIAGGSCAGKSWLADRISEAFPEKAVRICLDDFYLDRAHLSLPQRARLNFDHPRSIDWKRVYQVLSACREGREAALPRYDFATHARRPDEAVLGPAKLVIVEGLWLFRRAEVRRMLNLKVFIRSKEGLCVSRRIKRDTHERGRTREQVLEQLERYTLPGLHRFVAPQEKRADLIFEAPVSAAQVSQLLNRIAENYCAFGL